MEPIEHRVLVLGLPETGKSSFIQALDEVLKHPATPESLCRDGLADDRSYIHAGKPSFLAGEVPGRTDRQIDDTSVELRFKHPPTGQRGRLFLPDEKGEKFRDQWINRRWEKEYRESLAGIAGVLVFVRADAKPRNEERLGVLAKAIVSSGQERLFEMKEASAQVQLVDVLQFIAEFSAAPQPLRMAVLVSAWDTVGGPGDLRPRIPGKFVEKEWALLAQYLRSNPGSFTPKIYGVSAFGGVPGELKPSEVDKPAHERSRIVDDVDVSNESNDLTRPLVWLLQLN